MVSSDDAFAKLEKLSELHTKKIITDEEYQTKKNELLSSI
ncbi:MAG: SHOCT domain-containing protein [Bacillota bacterium]